MALRDLRYIKQRMVREANPSDNYYLSDPSGCFNDHEARPIQFLNYS